MKKSRELLFFYFLSKKKKEEEEEKSHDSHEFSRNQRWWWAFSDPHSFPPSTNPRLPIFSRIYMERWTCSLYCKSLVFIHKDFLLLTLYIYIFSLSLRNMGKIKIGINGVYFTIFNSIRVCVFVRSCMHMCLCF